MDLNLRRLLQRNSDQPLGGRYRILEQMGAGGFGQTFLAEDLHLPGHPRCVIKQLKPKVRDEQSLAIARRLFDTEAQVLYRLGNHDQIPRLLAHFEEQQEFYLAQELVEGTSLKRELENCQGWPEASVVGLLQDILQTLAFVHQQNVIHRDINPSNLICRDRDGKIVLIDFGAVKQASTQLANPAASPTQTIAIGTRGYMPNEQIAGHPRFSSDIYAVGMIGIQALTGLWPQRIQQDPRTGELIWQEQAPEMEPEFRAVLERMVCYDFRDRYPTATEALAAFEALLTAGSSAPFPIPNPPTATLDDEEEDLTLSVPDHLPVASFEQPVDAAETQTYNPAALNAMEGLDLGVDTTVVLPVQLKSEAKTEATLPLAVGAPHSDTPLGSASSSPAAMGTIASLSRQGLFKPLVLVSVAAGAGIILLKGWSGPESKPPAEPPVAASGEVSDGAPAPTPETPPAPPSATEIIQQGDQLRQAGQYQEAVSTYQQAIAQQSDSLTAHWGQCYSLNQLQKYAEAIAACDRALALNPNYVEALWSKGYALDQQQDLSAALALYARAVELQPDFAAGWSNQGTVLLKLERPAEAVAAYDQAVALDPNLAEAWNNRGAALWSLRRFDEAVVSVEKAIALQPNYADALQLRDQMRQKLNQ